MTVKIIQGNILASNGLLHILDRAMDKVVPTFESNTEVRTSGKSNVKSNPSSLVPQSHVHEENASQHHVLIFLFLVKF